ncbi:hypothetical protein ABZY58_12000 [Micromonospora tulbaghiae]|uniref:hypothetical protein n=1 Tax=Micromonospora tulbaghiae TaxID=479978 RepID=UPI0033A18954
MTTKTQPRRRAAISFERLLVGIKTGLVQLDPRDFRYRNTANGADMDGITYEAADRGWVHLAPGENPTITDAGEKWIGTRYALLGPSPTRPAFLAPGGFLPGYEKRRGERINTARLTEDQVRGIKARMLGGAGNPQLAREYGVDESTIRRIRTGTNWRHVA